MAAYAGNLFLIKIYTGASYVATGGYRNGRLRFNEQEIDVTTSDSVNRARELFAAPGMKSIELTNGGLWVDDSSVNFWMAVFNTAANQTNVQAVIPNLGTFQFPAFFKSFEWSANHDGVVEYTGEILSAGNWTFT